MDLDHSVTRLQEQVEVLQRERREDRESVREIRDDVKATREVVQRLEISLSSLISLQPKMGEHETRIRAVENLVEQGKGGWKAVSLISALSGGGVGAFISWLIHGKP